uniref:CIPKS n=1 Tax=Arundo donax TaxID=35708 RepID=A0A0A9BJS3_ARUDO
MTLGNHLRILCGHGKVITSSYIYSGMQTRSRRHCHHCHHFHHNSHITSCKCFSHHCHVDPNQNKYNR